LKNDSLDEQELKPLSKQSTTIDHVIKFDTIPKFFWEAFNSEVYCFEYKLINKNPVIFASNNKNNSFKIFNILGLELCRSNLDLPLPLSWNLPVSVMDSLKDKYIEAKKIQLQLEMGLSTPKWYVIHSEI
jgi:hypothetical protein